MLHREYIENYLSEVAEITRRIDREAVSCAVDILKGVREKKGRLFILGVGGSAANASHAVNDFRKIAHIQSYSPTDNVAELTARVNDDGWDSVFGFLPIFLRSFLIPDEKLSRAKAQLATIRRAPLRFPGLPPAPKHRRPPLWRCTRRRGSLCLLSWRRDL